MIKKLISVIIAFVISIIGIIGIHSNIGEKSSIEGTVNDVTISFNNEQEFFDYIDNNDNLLSSNNKENGYLYSVYKDSFAVIDRITTFSCKLLIPETLGGYKVIAVNNFGYSFCVKEVVIPDGIEFVISSMTDLKRVEKVTLPASLKYIQGGTFSECKYLKVVSLPKSIDVVSSCLFSECTNLKSVNLGDSIRIIEGDAFFYCTSLENILLPESVEIISSNAFDNCKCLKTINLSSSLVSIGNFAFNNCRKLKIDSLPDGLQKIGLRAFYNCSSLEELIIPDSVTEIGANAFKGCSNLTIVSSSEYVIEYAKSNGLNFRKT